MLFFIEAVDVALLFRSLKLKLPLRRLQLFSKQREQWLLPPEFSQLFKLSFLGFNPHGFCNPSLAKPPPQSLSPPGLPGPPGHPRNGPPEGVEQLEQLQELAGQASEGRVPFGPSRGWERVTLGPGLRSVFFVAGGGGFPAEGGFP